MPPLRRLSVWVFRPSVIDESAALRLYLSRASGAAIQFRGCVIISDGGLLAYRKLDDRPGLTDAGADALVDAHTGKNGRHLLEGLPRQSVEQSTG
jgi:hypothetical protein